MKAFLGKVWDAVLIFVGIVVFILTLNPVSMFFYNLFNPENAARLVREFIFFNDFWRTFYTRQVLKWPFRWSRHWITLGNLKKVSVNKQVAYYRAKGDASVLKAMSSEAQVALVRKYQDKMQEITELMRLTDEMFAEWLERIIEYDSENSSSIMEMRLFHPFNKYLEKGKLPFSQVMLLTKAAVKEKNADIYEGLMYDLYEYIERFGLSEKQLKETAQYMNDHLNWHDAFGEEPLTEEAKEYEQHKRFNHFYNKLSEFQINYDQRVFTRSQRGEKRTGEWEAFCKKTSYICIAAQREMDIEQYKIFHATGHTLRAKVITYFLNYPNRDLHRLIFRYEPSDVFEDKDIRDYINNNTSLKALFDKEREFVNMMHSNAHSAGKMFV